MFAQVDHALNTKLGRRRDSISRTNRVLSAGVLGLLALWVVAASGDDEPAPAGD